jgi:hypothetical protein
MNYFQLAQEITEPDPLELFKKLVERHDLTHAHSDSTEVYERGAKELDRIYRLGDKLDADKIAKIWNAQVNRKVKGAARKDYYWCDSKGEIPNEA